MSRDQANEFLKLAGRLFIGTAREDELAAYLQHPTDWSRLLQTAEREGMAGILAIQLQRLQGESGANLPIAPFSEALRHGFARNGNQLAELTRLREALRKKHIRVILLKGAALIETSYGGQIGLRPLSDVDILVKPSDIPVIRRELETMGFQPANRLSCFYTNGAAAFDLHTDLMGTSRIRRRADAARFDLSEVWEGARPLDDHDGPLLALNPSFQFLHLAVHGLKHSYSRLVWLVDLALVARQIDWEDLLERTRDSGTGRPLTYALSALERCLAVEIPREAREDLVRLNRMEKIFLDLVIARRREARALGEPILAFSIPSWSGRLAYLMEYLVPKRRTLSHDSSTTPSWFLVPKRLGQILRRGFSYLIMVLRSRASLG